MYYEAHARKQAQEGKTMQRRLGHPQVGDEPPELKLRALGDRNVNPSKTAW